MMAQQRQLYWCVRAFSNISSFPIPSYSRPPPFSATWIYVVHRAHVYKRDPFKSPASIWSLSTPISIILRSFSFRSTFFFFFFILRHSVRFCFLFFLMRQQFIQIKRACCADAFRLHVYIFLFCLYASLMSICLPDRPPAPSSRRCRCRSRPHLPT